MDSPTSVACFVELPPEGLDLQAKASKSESNAKEDDEKSVDSVPTLFSELSDSDDEQLSTESQLDPHIRLLKSFAERNRLLKKITAGKSPEYVRILKENEKMVQDEAMRLFHQKQAKQLEKKGLLTPTKKKQERRPASVVQHSPFAKLQRVLLLEFNHSLPGYLILCLYCLVHLSLFSLVSMVIQHCTWGTKTDSADEIIYCLFLGVGLALCRAVGTIWYHYVNTDTYRAVKFDIHNRLRQGDTDALLLRWFRKHPHVAAVIDLLGFYLVLVVMYNFQESLLYQLDISESILQSIPSAAYENVVTLAKERLAFGLPIYDEILGHIDDTLLQELTDRDEEFLESNLSEVSFQQLMGNEEAIVVDTATSVVFYVCCALLPAMFLSYRFKYNFDAH